jgi:hypothetical protein
MLETDSIDREEMKRFVYNLTFNCDHQLIKEALESSPKKPPNAPTQLLPSDSSTMFSRTISLIVLNLPKIRRIRDRESPEKRNAEACGDGFVDLARSARCMCLSREEKQQG